MNCDDFLSAIEDGDGDQRNAAVEHAGSCPTCAGKLIVLQEIKAALAVHEPLPKSARLVWENASRISRPMRWQCTGWAVPSAVAATIAVCFVFVAMPQRINPPPIVVPEDGENIEVVTSSSAETTVLVPDVVAQLTELSSAAETLDEMLSTMSEQVDRMEVEREVQVTLSRFGRW